MYSRHSLISYSGSVPTKFIRSLISYSGSVPSKFQCSLNSHSGSVSNNMLRKLYLVSSDKFPLAPINILRKMYLMTSHKFPLEQPATPPQSYGESKTKMSKKLPLKKQRHPCDKLFRFREKIQETNIKREVLIRNC